MKILFKPEAEDYLHAINDEMFRFLEYIAEKTDLMKLIDKLQYYLYELNTRIKNYDHLTEDEIYRALEREVNLKRNCKKGGRSNNVQFAIQSCIKEPSRIYEIIKWYQDTYKISSRSIYRIKKGIKEHLKPNCKKMFCMFELQKEIHERNELTSPCLFNFVP